MKKALVFTAYNRLRYLQESLFSWDIVRGIENWHVVFRIEPSDIDHLIAEEFREFALRNGLTDYEIILNKEKLGVLKHPYIAINELFQQGYDFVVRVEDDIRVSTDTLEYFEYTAEEYQNDQEIAAICTNSYARGGAEEIFRTPKFDPLNWGTWRDRWDGLLSKNWDFDYSTGNNTPENPSGWDANFNKRVFPAHNLKTITPVTSRSRHIGVVGTHGDESNFLDTPHFTTHVDEQEYEEVMVYLPI